MSQRHPRHAGTTAVLKKKEKNKLLYQKKSTPQSFFFFCFFLNCIARKTCFPKVNQIRDDNFLLSPDPIPRGNPLRDKPGACAAWLKLQRCALENRDLLSVVLFPPVECLFRTADRELYPLKFYTVQTTCRLVYYHEMNFVNEGVC